MIRLLVVEDAFTTRGAGVLVLPKFVVATAGREAISVRLRAPSGEERDARAVIETTHIRGPGGSFGMYRVLDVTLADLPTGTEIWATAPAPSSLLAGRERAHEPEEIELPDTVAGAVSRVAVVEALARVKAAFTADFPENIFIDLDRLGSTLASSASPAELAALADRACGLSRDFGGPPIRFRYAHDFLYGFDWCRWVARAPEERAAVGPFDLPFLEYLSSRAGELRELIEKDDTKYGRIGSGTFRNPFGFSRAPDDERRLHQTLAARGLIPVEAWTANGAARWDKPYATLREEVARELGLVARDET